MSNEDRWKKILASQAEADRKKDEATRQLEIDEDVKLEMATRAAQIWRVKQGYLEDQIRVMNEQMSGDRKLFPKSLPTELLTVGVHSVSTKNPLQNHARSARCEFRAYASGVLRVSFQNVPPSERLDPREIDLMDESNDELEDALLSFAEACL